MPRRRGVSLVTILALTAVIGLLIAMLLPMNRSARGAAHRNHCLNNLKQISLAILNYEREHGTLPPVFSVDADGKPLHSWRALLVPYLEGHQPLAAQIDFSKPWNDPANAQALASMPECYMCPSSVAEAGLTTYVAVVGPECVFTGSTPRPLSEITDGDSNTIAFVEVDSSHAVPWMAPQDTDVEFLMGLTAESPLPHPGTFQAARVDGGTFSLFPSSIKPEALRGLLTVAGGKKGTDH